MNETYIVIISIKYVSHYISCIYLVFKAKVVLIFLVDEVHTIFEDFWIQTFKPASVKWKKNRI